MLKLFYPYQLFFTSRTIVSYRIICSCFINCYFDFRMNKQLSKLNILNNNLFDNKVTITLFFFLEKSIHNRQSLSHDDARN